MNKFFLNLEFCSFIEKDYETLAKKAHKLVISYINWNL